MLPLLWGITLVAFLIANAVPADPITANLPQNALNDERLVEAFREKWGLNKPLHEQYLTYLGNVLQGDLGTSIKTRRPIVQDIALYLPATIELSSFAIVIGIVMGVSLGVIAAVWRNHWIDFVARFFSLIGVSFPVFLLALLALAVFYGQLRLTAGPGRLNFIAIPPPTVTGLYTIDSLLAGQWATFQNALAHLVLPSFVLGSYISGTIARITRSAMIEVMGRDYMRTARSKGLSPRRVLFKHGLSNALIPVVTVIGVSYGNLLAGAVLTESIFAWPGIGRYMYQASVSQDFPAIMGVSMLIAFIYIVINFIVDLLYFALDPRMRSTN